MTKERKRKLRRAGYNALQWTWGLPQTLAGAVLYFRHRDDVHFDYTGARATVWERDAGVSLGKFIFVPGDSSASKSSSGRDKVSLSDPLPAGADSVNRFLLDHEYGHTIQSLMLGPLYFVLVGAPSFAWNRLPYFSRMRKKTGRSYYSAVFERTANSLGAKMSRGKH